MKTNATQQEILLITNNSFAQKQWSNKQNNSNDDLSAQEQLEEVCANGLLPEILPEVFAAPGNDKLYLWQMRPGFSFLQLEYGYAPFELNKATSIDPHNSIGLFNYN